MVDGFDVVLAQIDRLEVHDSAGYRARIDCACPDTWVVCQ